MNRSAVACLALFVAASIAAQPAETGEPRVFRSEVELQLYNFGNFFQVGEGLPQESVNGYGAEYRGAYRAHENAPDLYGSLNVVRYGGAADQTSYGGRIGVSRYGSVHSFNAYVDRQENGYAFEVGDVTAAANITTVGGNYAYRVARNWQAGIDTYMDWQRFDIATGAESEYRNIGVQLRYRGFGQRLQPRIGYVTGAREVETDAQSYDDRYWYVQLTSVVNPRVTASIRYRDRTRDYQNINRIDERNQWLLRGTFRQSDRLAWTGSYSRESTDSTLASRDFDTNVGFVGLIVGF